MTIRPLAATVALLLLVGCTSPPPPTPVATAQDVEADAMAAVARGDWAGAADLLRRALRQNPTSAKLHYHLAVAASHLDLRDEAIREFQWIVANLAPRKLRGLTSQGMIVAASLEDTPPVLAAFLEDVPAGARLK